MLSKIWGNRYTYALYLSLAATPMNVIGYFGTICTVGTGTSLTMICTLLFCIGLLLTIVAYCLSGFWTVIKFALGIAKWGFLLVFPINLMAVTITIVLAFMMVLLTPIFPVHKAYKAHVIQ